MRMIVIVIALVSGLIGSAFAQTGYINNVPFNFPNGAQTEEYKRCAQTADCASFAMPCSPPIAVNRRYLPMLEQSRLAVEGRYGCNVGKADLVNVPLCQSGYCMIGPPTVTAMDIGNPRFCNTVGDCTVATDHCGRKFPVNNQNLSLKQDSLDSQNPESAGCPWVETRPVKQMKCDYNRCKVIMDNHADNPVSFDMDSPTPAYEDEGE